MNASTARTGASVRPPKGWPRWIAAHPRGAWYWFSSVLAVALYAVAAPVGAVTYGIPVIVALVLPLVQAASIIAVMRFPWVAIVAFAVATSAEALSMDRGAQPWPWNVTAIIGFFVITCATWAIHGWRHGLAAYLLPAGLVTLPVIGSLTLRSLPSLIVALSIGLIAVGIGALLSDRIQIAGQLTRERATSEAETERRLVAEERQRIARELHDVVAHGLSLIQVQATSAPYRLKDLEPRASEEFESIAQSARESLHEMRRLLSALRGDEATEHAPQPTLRDIGQLVAETTRAGAEVRLEMPEIPSLSPAVEIAAFRIVQEAISNAVRHAPGTRIHVIVGATDDALLVEVQNDAGAAGDARPTGSGHGLVGMRERATLLGGSFQAGRTAAGGFRVAASLPFDGTGDAAPAGGDPE